MKPFSSQDDDDVKALFPGFVEIGGREFLNALAESLTDDNVATVSGPLIVGGGLVPLFRCLDCVPQTVITCLRLTP